LLIVGTIIINSVFSISLFGCASPGKTCSAHVDCCPPATVGRLVCDFSDDVCKKGQKCCLTEVQQQQWKQNKHKNPKRKFNQRFVDLLYDIENTK